MKMLKTEEVYIAGYETFADVANRLPRFIEEVYNAKEAAQDGNALGWRTPCWARANPTPSSSAAIDHWSPPAVPLRS